MPLTTITGLTATRMALIEGACVVDGDVVGNDLILHQFNGTDINAGNVRGPTGAAGTNGLTPELRGVSTTSLTIGTGSKTFTVTAMNVAFPVGTIVKAIGVTPSNYMVGNVTAATTTSVTINVTEIGGSGTLASWTLTIGAFKGLDGTGTVNSVNGVSPTATNVNVVKLVHVASTQSPGTNVGYWAKLLTLNLSVANDNNDLIVNIDGVINTFPRSASGVRLLISTRNGPTSPSTASQISILSGQGFSPSNFRLIRTVDFNGSNTGVWELWIQAAVNYTAYRVYLEHYNVNGAIAYENDSVFVASPSSGTQEQVLGGANTEWLYGTVANTNLPANLQPAAVMTTTKGGSEKVAALSATMGTCTGDLSVASIFTVSPSGNITLAFTNIPATGTSCALRVMITQTATVRTVTMPSGTKWIGAPAPTQVANKLCIIDMDTIDGGTTWVATGGVEQ